MTNVLSFKAPSRPQTVEARVGALLHCFATERRIGDDVFWLKENAELLNVLETAGIAVPREALAPHQGFYDGVEKRLSFFPQYYRFLVSIALDLEDLGMPGDKGCQLVEWVVENDLVGAELSDLQRLEARRLCLRRGLEPLPHDTGLEDRVRRFTERSATFALPNKKAAYELTHAVFYLSEYGRKDPMLGDATVASLHYAGLLAFLEQNADLLAEICVAMRFAGLTPPEAWTTWIDRDAHLFHVECDRTASVNDDYHAFLMCNWAQLIADRRAFTKYYELGRMRFEAPRPSAAPLRQMSECMYNLEDRRGGWEQMRGRVWSELCPDAQDVLAAAEASSTHFDGFFQDFARAASMGVTL
ncbi:MAG: hypothetical protein MK160_07035 [Rhodobacteraceae bacterium]|nr:hypothetical protein [Paracoccaceae bacterium]